ARERGSASDLDENFLAFDPDRMAGDAESRIGLALPGCDVVLEPVPGAGDHAFAQITFPERAAPVGAGVRRGVDGATHVVERHRLAPHLHGFCGTGRQIRKRRDLDEVSYEGASFGFGCAAEDRRVPVAASTGARGGSQAVAWAGDSSGVIGRTLFSCRRR